MALNLSVPLLEVSATRLTAHKGDVLSRYVHYPTSALMLQPKLNDLLNMPDDLAVTSESRPESPLLEIVTLDKWWQPERLAPGKWPFYHRAHLVQINIPESLFPPPEVLTFGWLTTLPPPRLAPTWRPSRAHLSELVPLERRLHLLASAIKGRRRKGRKHRGTDYKSSRP